MTSTNSDALMNLILAALLTPKPPFAQVFAGAANVGNGGIIDIDWTNAVVIGDYRVDFIDATHYTVHDPNGVQLLMGEIGEFVIGGDPIGGQVVGGRFGAGGIGFQVVAGDVAFAAGDSFIVRTTYPTGAGKNVFAPRDWPAPTDQYPMLKLSSPTEHKVGLGPNGPQFMTTTVVRVTGSVVALPTENDAGAGICQAALGVLQRQIELAVINDYDLFLVIQEMDSVAVESKVTQQGEQHVGELTMDFSMKFPQGPEDFAPPVLMSIDQIAVFADLVQPADKLGVYVPPINYVPVPAPRTQGPDGRVEGTVTVNTNA